MNFNPLRCITEKKNSFGVKSHIKANKKQENIGYTMCWQYNKYYCGIWWELNGEHVVPREWVSNGWGEEGKIFHHE